MCPTYFCHIKIYDDDDDDCDAFTRRVQWLDELKHEYPWLYLNQITGSLLYFCSSDAGSELRIQLLTELLGQEGGIYVGSSTWILNFPSSFRSVDVDVGLDPDAMEGYMILRAGVVSSNTSVTGLLLEKGHPKMRRRSSCGRIHHIYHRPDLVNHTGACLVVSGEGFERFYPMDIWDRDDAFGRLVRRLFYGTESIRRPAPSSGDLVPNLAHMIWVGGGQMPYVFYLSVLSLLYVAGMDVVYIHGNMPPTGPLWEEIKTLPQTRNRVKFITRTLPLKVHSCLYWFESAQL